MADLETIHSFIADDAPAYAALEVEKILAAVERLIRFPLSGRQVPEKPVTDVREIIVGSYRVVYRLRAELIEPS